MKLWIDSANFRQGISVNGYEEKINHQIDEKQMVRNHINIIVST